jgi:hypothetical protein
VFASVAKGTDNRPVLDQLPATKAGKNPIFSEKKIGFLVFGAKTRWFLVFPLPVTPILVSERPAGNTRQHNSLTYKHICAMGKLVVVLQLE